MAENDLLESIREIENAKSALLKLDHLLENIGNTIANSLGFDFVAIQLINKEHQTIETVYGTGASAAWAGLAIHTTKGDPELWDIQAHIVMNNPPRIEIIAGRDRRFDDYLFNKFGHKGQSRIFAPIILTPSEIKLETLHWDVLDELSPNVDEPSADDRRTVYRSAARTRAAQIDSS